MFDETIGNFFVHCIVVAKNERDLKHALAVERHPCRAVGLIEVAARRQRGAAVEDTDVVQSEESARENVSSLRVLAIYPPVEIQHQALERAFEEAHVGASQFGFDPVEEQRCPGVYWW